MEALPVKTERHEIEVVVCPWCDGGTIPMAAKGNHVDPNPNYKPEQDDG